MSKSTFKDIKEKNVDYICSSKCIFSELPFFSSDNIDFFSALFGENEFPCAKCKRDCLDMSPCIQCSICDDWHHFECTNLTINQFNTNPYFFCSRKCELRVFPFVDVNSSILFEENIFLPIANNVPKKRPQKNKKDTNNTEIIDKKITVDTNKFMKINCSYLDPNEIKESFFEVGDTDLTIFQNNIRSLNKNFHIVKEIFKDCDKTPDILSFSETMLRSNSNIPPFDGYSFHHVNSLNGCGGVGVYVSNRIDYTVRNDLSINIDDCEDIWI